MNDYEILINFPCLKNKKLANALFTPFKLFINRKKNDNIFIMSAELEFNYKSTKKLPINRNSLFYSENDFLFEEEIGKDLID